MIWIRFQPVKFFNTEPRSWSPKSTRHARFNICDHDRESNDNICNTGVI